MQTKWGRNLAVRVPADVARAARLSEGERVEIEACGSEIVIRRAVPHVSIEELFRSKPPSQWRRAHRNAYDWGPERGRKVVDE